MYSSALYQVLLLVLIVAVIVLIFVLVRTYMILTDLNDASKKIKTVVDDVYSTVVSVKASVLEYQAMIKGLVLSVTSMSGIRDIINKFKNKSDD